LEEKLNIKDKYTEARFLVMFLTVIPYHGIFAALFIELLESFTLWFWFLGIHFFVVLFMCVFGDDINIFSIGARSKKEFMNDEKHVIELFDEILAVCKSKNINCPYSLYIIDEKNISAFAMSNQIVISRMALDSLEDEELKGLIAHEIGHLHNSSCGFMRFISGSVFIGSLAVNLYKYSSSNILTHFLFFCLPYYLKVVSSHYFRINEFYADEVAVKLGYGEGLMSTLNKLYQFDMRKPSSIDRLTMTHPPTAIRIVEIEKLLENTSDADIQP